MIIVTGSGRSGTKTLAKLLGGHHEFRSSYIVEKHFTRAVGGEDPFSSREERLSAALDLFQGIDEETFIDSSNLHIHYLDAIFLLFPKARFILTLRNGKDFVRSACSRKWHKQETYGTMPLPADPFYDRWQYMSPLQKNAWIWSYRNGKALCGMRIIPASQKLTIRIEEIAEPRTIRRLEGFVERKIEVKEVRPWNANPSFDMPPPENWTEEMKASFDEIAAPMMRRLGYY